jgi:Cu-processing system permease protein
MSGRSRGLPLAVSQVRAIAVNTFREAVRSRIFYILMAFAVAMILLSAFMALLTVGSRNKILVDLGLSFSSIFSVLTAIFVGIGLVYHEVERKTIYNVLSKPLSRARFILGRYIGLMAVLLVNLLAMMTLLSLVLLLFKGFTWQVFAAAGFIYLEVAVLTALALFFSSVSSPVVSALCTGAFFVVGRTSSTLEELLAPELHGKAAKGLVNGLYHLLPDLSVMDITNLVAYDIPIARGFTLRAILYAAAWVALLLTAACLSFRRRDLV